MSTKEHSSTNELEDSRILVIGGAGFIGSHIVDQLLEEPVEQVVVLDNFIRGARTNLMKAREDDRVQVVEGSIMDVQLLRDLMQEVDYAFHLAALWLYECVHEPRKALEVNVNGTYNVIEAARDTDLEKLVYSSSASVYGDAVEIPMNEDHPFNNRTMYGATKIAGEQFLRAFNEESDLDYVGLRYMNVYGPRMDYKGTYTSVIMKVLDRIHEGKPPLIFGDGSQSYDFVHVSDVARANILALKSEATDEFINVGRGVKTSINELVHQLIEVTGTELEPEYRSEEESFVTHRIGGTKKAKELIDFEAEVGLDEGLRSVVEWRATDQADFTVE